MGEYKVHHIRFFEYAPKAVHCLAFDPTQQKVALSRADGSIEIWSVADNFYQEKILAGTDERSVEALVWCDKRLLSAGLHGYIQEHDLLTHQVKLRVSANSGAVWCMVLNDSKTKIAAGTEEGCVVVFDVANGNLEHHRTLDRQEGRILCLAWHEAEQVVVTGGLDNLRVWSLKSGHAIQRLSPGRAEVHKETVVWAVAITKDFTIVSGDSRGKVCFWNGSQGTQIKSFNCSKADVLCLSVTSDGSSVFASGVEPVVTQFEFVALQANSDWKRWVKTNVTMKHTHDVRAMVCTDKSLISAGVDTRLIVNSLHQDMKQQVQRSRKIQAIPHHSLASMSRAHRLILLNYPTHLDLWQLGYTNSNSDMDGEILALKANCMKLLELKSRGDEQIVCAQISACGRWLCYSDVYKLRLFRLNVSGDNKGSTGSGVPQVSLKKVSNLPEDVPAAHRLCFTQDGSHLIVANCLTVIQILKLDDQLPTLVHTIFIDTGESVHLLTVSEDGKMFAYASHSSDICIYSLETYERLCVLPKYHRQPTALTFHPKQPILTAVYTDRMVVEFNINEKEYTDWTREFKRTLFKNFHWSKRPTILRQLFYHPCHDNQLWLCDENSIYILDKTQRFPRPNEQLHKPGISSKEQALGHCVHVCTKYQWLLHMDALATGELVVVERTPSAIHDALPQSLKSKKFGT